MWFFSAFALSLVAALLVTARWWLPPLLKGGEGGTTSVSGLVVILTLTFGGTSALAAVGSAVAALRRRRESDVETRAGSPEVVRESVLEVVPEVPVTIASAGSLPQLPPPPGDFIGAAPVDLTSWSGRPDTIGDSLVGRKGHLDKIEGSFKDHRAVVLSGGAGTGKSRLAAEYTHHTNAHGFWTSAGNNVAQTLAALARHLIVGTESRSDEEIAADVQRLLSGLPLDTLWVIDNLHDLELINDILNSTQPVHLLLTTRDARRQLVPSTVAFHEVDVLDTDPAVTLLCSRSDCDPSQPALTEICDAVGRLPLALEMLAVRLGEPLQTPQRVLERLRKAPTAIELEAFERTAGATIPRSEGVLAVIAGTLGELTPEMRQAMGPLGYVEDAPVPVALISALTDLQEDGLDRLLSECSRQSILSLVEGSAVIHSLTAAAIAATNPEGALETAAARFLARLSSICSDDPVAVRAELAHHERIVEEAKRGLGSEAVSVLDLANELAVAYYGAGRYDDAIRIFEETLEVRERVLGPEHPDTLSTRSNLANAYVLAGRIDEAILIHEETLAFRARVLGAENPATLISRNSLAFAYSAAGRTDDAIRIFEGTLEVRERVLGPEHPHTLTSRNNLAAAYYAAGRTDDAIRIHEEILEVRERVLSLDHPDALISRNNLAEAYRVVGRIDDAIPIHEKTLEVLERVQGPEHPDTLISRSNLALAYRDAGRTDDAIRILGETLEARERVLGPEHPHTLISRNNLVMAYRAAGRYAEADRLSTDG